MTSLRATILLCVLLLPISGQAAEGGAAPELDLPAAISRALTHNQRLMQQALGVRAAASELREREAAFKPKLQPRGELSRDAVGERLASGLEASQQWIWGTRVSGALEGQRQGEAADNERYTGRLRLEISQPLFRNAGRLVNEEPLVAGRQQLKAQRRAQLRAQSALVLEVVRQFEELARLRDRLASDESSLERLSRLERITQVKERQGRGTRVDTLRVELQRGEAENRLTRNRESLRNAQDDFADLLGDPPGTSYTLIPPPPFELELLPLKTLQATAFSNRVEWAQVQQDVLDAERGLKIRGRLRLPDLRVTTRYDREGRGKDLAAASALNEDDWFVGLTVGDDLLRPELREQLLQAELDLDGTQLQQLLVERELLRELRRHRGAYRQAVTEEKNARNNLDLARKRRELSTRLFDRGRASNFTVTDAEEAFSAAENAWQQARSEVAVSGYSLLHSLGLLVDCPEDLKAAALHGGKS